MFNHWQSDIKKVKSSITFVLNEISNDEIGLGIINWKKKITIPYHLFQIILRIIFNRVQSLVYSSNNKLLIFCGRKTDAKHQIKNAAHKNEVGQHWPTI